MIFANTETTARSPKHLITCSDNSILSIFRSPLLWAAKSSSLDNTHGGKCLNVFPPRAPVNYKVKFKIPVLSAENPDVQIGYFTYRVNVID